MWNFITSSKFVRVFSGVTTVGLPVVLYGCETWHLTLRQEKRLWVLKRTFGPEKDEVARGKRKFHNEELHNSYYSLNKLTTRRMRWAAHVAGIREIV
jgi:hypothetical protein